MLRISPPAWGHKLVKGRLDKVHVLRDHASHVTPPYLHITLDATAQPHVIICRLQHNM
jgi:hypothetical protein